MFIEVPFGFDASNLGFGKVDRNQSATRTTYVTATDAGSLKGIDLVSSSKYITARVAENTGDDLNGKKLPIEVSLTPGLPLGRFTESVTAKSKAPGLPDASLMVTGTIIGPVEASPESVRFVLMQSAGNSVVPEYHKVLLVNHDKEHTLKILSYKDPDDRVTLELKPVNEGQEYELQIRPKAPGDVKGTINGNIQIETNNSAQPEVDVKYSIVPRA